MSLDVEEHVLYRIANTPILEYPFPHQFVPSVFPADFYKELLASLPAEGVYRPLSEGGTVGAGAYPDRTICDLADLEEYEAQKQPAGHLFSDLGRWLLGDRFRDFVVEHFAKQVRERFGPDVADLRTDVDGRFIRDHTNYAIGPHTDTPKKLVSMLFYLPKDESTRHLGTSVYVPIKAGFRCNGGAHHDFRKFRQVFTAPYVPNSLFLFFKNDVAFHGVEPIKDERVERNLLLYNIYVNKVIMRAPPASRWNWFTRKAVNAN